MSGFPLDLEVSLMQAEEIDTLISELARVSGGERALAEECGHLLFKTYASQVPLPLHLP